MKGFNVTEKAICSLISSAVFGNALILPDNLDWQAVYKELFSHAILGMFRDITPVLNIPQDVKQAWDLQNYSIIAKSVQIGEGQRKLVKLLNENDVSYAILKGTAAAQYYPIAYSRNLGDVDFVVKEADYTRTQKLLEENGYMKAFAHEDNYRHESFNKDGVHYECHHLFADRSFHHAEKIDKLIVGNIDNAIETETEYGKFLCLPNAINGIVLLEHIAIHIKSGLGLRQILDWLLFVDNSLSDADWAAENGRVIREAGLDILAKVITRAGQLYFGLNGDLTWCKDASEEVCEAFIQLVFSYGNFGNKNTIDEKIVGVAQRYRRGVLSNLRLSGEHNWKALHKYPWLKPLAPIYQIGRYTKQVLTGKGALKALVSNKKAVDDRERLMMKLGI